MSNAVVWAVILLAIAIGLFFVELLLPTGGMVALLAALALVGGIFMLFDISTTVGLIGAAVTVVLGIPLGITILVKVWPNTPMGRAMTLRNPHAESQESPPESRADDLPKVGQTGKAVTDMRPIGTCLIGDKRVQCLAESGMILAGGAVRVVAVDGMQVKVRAQEA